MTDTFANILILIYCIILFIKYEKNDTSGILFWGILLISMLIIHY